MKKRLIIVAVLTAMIAIGTGCTESAPTVDDNVQQNVATNAAEPTPKEKSSYGIGETWTVDGQWSFTITSVAATEDRNQFSDKNPGAVYIVDYEYTNLGYEDSSGLFDGLFIGIDDSIVDSAGVMGYSYPGNKTLYAQETPVGATCKAQECIGVDNPGDFKINITKYDGNSKKQKATFDVTVQ